MEKKKVVIGVIGVVLILVIGIVIGGKVHITIEPNESKVTSGEADKNNEEKPKEDKSVKTAEKEELEESVDQKDKNGSGSVIIKENEEQEVVPEKDDNTYFAKSQFKTSSFSEDQVETKIYDDEEGKNYKPGEYAEIDEAVEVIRQYLNGETDYYSQLVEPGESSQDEEKYFMLAGEEAYKDRDKDYLLLQTQFEFEPGTKVDFVINRVEYDGEDLAYDVGAGLMIKYSAYPEGSEYGFWDIMSITVYNIDGKLYFRVF